ncbi:polymer-forming cytoskeletal protein [Vibrio breoganii]|uniref:Polymer-forming cytoskeletal protein n=2 Tax=Vibrio breoganii TaxID=553239 RepID=A0ABX1U9A1_9VIBR|nr:polymer-forming cytoskeletal protein [Vibrio breoganii]NMR69920.1 polymer-forming cytoskeletal protein [Vibrio breoganii]
MAKGCQVEGQFKLESDMHVDGTVIGQVSVEQSLIVSQSGRVIGDIFAGKVIVNGIIEGSCHATSIEILENGQVQGTIYTDDLSIERGGKFNGDTKPSEKEQVVELGSKDKLADAKNTKQAVNS